MEIRITCRRGLAQSARERPGDVEAAFRSEIDVDEHDVREQRAGVGQRLVARRRDRDDGDALAFEAVLRGLQEGSVVIHDQARQNHDRQHGTRPGALPIGASCNVRRGVGSSVEERGQRIVERLDRKREPAPRAVDVGGGDDLDRRVDPGGQVLAAQAGHACLDAELADDVRILRDRRRQRATLHRRKRLGDPIDPDDRDLAAEAAGGLGDPECHVVIDREDALEVGVRAQKVAGGEPRLRPHEVGRHGARNREVADPRRA